MPLQINWLILLHLEKLSAGTSLDIAIIQICLLSSIMTLGMLLQHAAQFNIHRCLDVKEQIFHYCFTLGAKFVREPIKEVTRWWRSELRRIIGSFTRFEEMESGMRICFPIHFVVSVSLKHSSCTQIDSKSNIAKLLKSLCSLVYSILKESSLSNRVSWVWYTIFGSTFFTRSLHVVKCCSKLNIPLKKVWQLGQRKERKTALMLFT